MHTSVYDARVCMCVCVSVYVCARTRERSTHATWYPQDNESIAQSETLDDCKTVPANKLKYNSLAQ